MARPDPASVRPGKVCWRAGLLILVTSAASAFGLGDLFGGGGGVGTVVYDPANHLQTAISAAQAVRQTALQVQAEVQRVQQLALAVRQANTLPQDVVAAGLRDWSGQLAALGSAEQALARVNSWLVQDQASTVARLRQQVLLGQSPGASLRDGAATGLAVQGQQEALRDAARTSIPILQDAVTQLTRLQAQIPASGGLQQSLQTTNQYLDVLAGQSQTLLRLTSAQLAGQGQQAAQDAARQATLAVREAQRIEQDTSQLQAWRQAIRADEARTGLGLLPPLAAPAAAPAAMTAAPPAAGLGR